MKAPNQSIRLDLVRCSLLDVETNWKLIMSHRNAPDVQIDHIHADAVCQGIGERLRETLSQSPEMPQRLRELIARLPELDRAQTPSIIPAMDELTH